MSRSLHLSLVVTTCLIAMLGCGQSSSAGGTESAGAATDAVTGACRADTDCVLADLSCGQCGCPTEAVTRAAFDARQERCGDVDVRCPPVRCPPATEHAACVDNRCVAVSNAGNAGGAVTRGSTEEETRCVANDECTSVSADCCPCAADDWVPANQASSAAVRARNRPTRCEACPSQDCPALDRLCVDGHCVVRER